MKIRHSFCEIVILLIGDLLTKELTLLTFNSYFRKMGSRAKAQFKVIIILLAMFTWCCQDSSCISHTLYITQTCLFSYLSPTRSASMKNKFAHCLHCKQSETSTYNLEKCTQNPLQQTNDYFTELIVMCQNVVKNSV